MLTLNQDVEVGGEKLHVQTEPYRSSGEVVANILKNGIVVKRVSQAIPPDATESEIAELVKTLHYSVIAAIQQQYEGQGKVQAGEVKQETVAQEEKQVFALPEDIVEKLVDYATNYVGFVAPELVSNLIESATSLEDFMEKYKAELSEAEDINEFLSKVFRKYIFDLSVNIDNFVNIDFKRALNRKLLEDIYFEEFGLLASQVVEEAERKLSEVKSLDEAIEVLKSLAEEEETKRKIEENRKRLFRI